MHKFLAIGALALLTACAGARNPDPVQQQAWSNAGTRGSSMECDYMPKSCDGWRSGGQTGVHAGGSVLVSSEGSKSGFPSEWELRPGDEARWESLYATTLNQLVAEKKIAAPTYAAYAAAYGKPRSN